jgi:hypothetical protein
MGIFACLSRGFYRYFASAGELLQRAQTTQEREIPMLSKAKMFGAVVFMSTMLIGFSVQADPALTIQSEEAAHPNIVAAIREMKAALKHLEEAPHDFGGNKGAAMADTRKAIHSLKKALYFRLKMDDAAIDRAQ